MDDAVITAAPTAGTSSLLLAQPSIGAGLDQDQDPGAFSTDAPGTHGPIPTHLLLLAAATLLLCVLDATFTLALIESSLFFEANPVMDLLLRIDTRLFVVAKVLVTGSALALLLRHWHRTVFRALPVASLVVAVFVMYVVLVSYEIGMLALVVA